MHRRRWCGERGRWHRRGRRRLLLEFERVATHHDVIARTEVARCRDGLPVDVRPDGAARVLNGETALVLEKHRMTTRNVLVFEHDLAVRVAADLDALTRAHLGAEECAIFENKNLEDQHRRATERQRTLSSISLW